MVLSRSVSGISAFILFTLLAGGAAAQTAVTAGKVEQTAGPAGKIDWTTGVISAVGIGAPPAQPESPAQARSQAEREAMAAARRNLLEAAKGVRIDATTTVESAMIANEEVRSWVNGIILGALVMDRKYLSDGSIEVSAGIRLNGALADAVLPKAPPARPTGFGPPPDASAGQGSTGLIVDARGLSVAPALAPRILNEDGKEAYGPAWVSREWAVREGMVGYFRDAAAPQPSRRVGDKPLKVKALKSAGDGRTDLIISNADGATLRGEGQNMRFLETCRVIILVD